MASRVLYDYNADFRQELDRLNPAQRAAVDSIEGPVMVLAGPGTGKTHLLAARIGNILLKTDAGAHNILCLTFTDSGVTAMRERLLRFIGPEAHRVAIHTFHGFCSRVIQQNLHYFGRPGLEPLSELERIRIIRGLLDGLPQTDPLRLGYHDTYHYEKHLQDLFAQMKAENWTVDGMEQRITAYVRDLPTHPDYVYQRKYKDKRAGDPKTGQIEEESRRMARLASAVALFPLYQQALRQQRRYDYGDMIGWVLRAFHDNPSLLLSYQERYRYLLVDEFQDTNGSQARIIRHLSEYWENPNVFIVGDDDQAIYEFQGARLNAMVDFHDRYVHDLQLVTLTENYRSTQAVLDSGDALIRHNTLRIGDRLPDYGIDKRLNNNFSGGDAGAVSVLAFNDRQQEVGSLIECLTRWHATGVPWSEMAVIYARHGQADVLRPILERSGIPYRSKRRPNVLDARPVRQLRELLSYLRAEHERPNTGAHLLFRILHFRCFGLPAYDLSRFHLARLDASGPDHRPPDWRKFLHHREWYPSGITSADELYRAGAWLESAIGQIGNLPLAEYVEMVLNGSGLLTDLLRDPDRAELVQQVSTLTDFISGELARRPRLGLGGLLDTLDEMDANRISLPLRSHLDQGDAVLLVTAHSAKGLEFEKVWMLDCSEKTWGTGGGGGRDRFKLPDTLTFSGPEDGLEARRRLFFVALTRARSEVILSIADRDARDRRQERVLFIDELTAAGTVEIQRPVRDGAANTSLSVLRLQPNDITRPLLLERSAITDLLTDFRLSVSALYAYLDCPLRFYYEKLLRVPDRERERATYGTVLHEALQNHFLRMKRDPGRLFPSREELIYTFEVSLGKKRGMLTRRVYDEQLERGRRELAGYYDRFHREWGHEVEVEYYIGNAEVDGIPLVGMIDRVDILSDAFVRVLDYKTSVESEGKLRRPTAKKPDGGTHWRQLTFYKLLYDHRPGNLRRVKEGRISYLLANRAGEHTEAGIELLRKDTDALRAILRTVWDAIQDQQFEGCGKSECDWCRFAQDLTDEAPSRTDTGLDDPL